MAQLWNPFLQIHLPNILINLSRKSKAVLQKNYRLSLQLYVTVGHPSQFIILLFLLVILINLFFAFCHNGHYLFLMLRNKNYSFFRTRNKNYLFLECHIMAIIFSEHLLPWFVLIVRSKENYRFFHFSSSSLSVFQTIL